MDRIHRRASAVYIHGGHVHGRVYGPCPQPLPAWTAVYGPVYTADHGPCTWSVYDSNTAMYPVPGRVYGPCTRLLTSVHAGPGTWPYISEHGHVHSRVLCTRSSKACTRPRERTVYMAMHGPCTIYGHVPSTRSSLRPVYTAVYGLCTRPWMYRVHDRAWAMYPVHRRVYVFSPWTWHFLRPVYTAVYTALHGPCTQSTAVFTVRTQGTRLWTTVYTFRKHDRVHGTRQCRQALNTAVFTVRTRLCTRAINMPVYMVHSRARPCTVHGRTMYMALAWSCTQSVHGPGHVPCTWTALYTGRKHGRVITC